MNLTVERPELLVLLLLALPVLLLARTSRRRLGPARWALVLGTRLALLTTLVLALAGLSWRSAVDALGVVFVVDGSASVGTRGSEQARDFVRAALEHRGPDDRVGIVVFGAEGLVQLEPTDDPAFGGVEVRPSPHQSDLAAGLRLGTALLPADRTRRLVLLSDGEQTRGDAAGQALLAAGGDLTLSVVPLAAGDGPDVRVEDVLAPSRVDEGATYEVRVGLHADRPTTGTLRLYRDDTFLGDRPVQLAGGRTEVFAIPQVARAPGLDRYRAVFEPDDPTLDGQTRNDQAMTTVQVLGRPRVLVVDRDPGSLGSLRQVLENEGLQVDLVQPASVPVGLDGLRAYAALVISDVPAWAFTRRQQEAVQTFVRDLGRGLVMIGGPESFGVGGYYRSPVEAALPVGVDLEDKTRFPTLAMVHALDKSGSMGSGSPSKMDLAKEAVLQTVDLLSPTDQLGVIGFDGAASFIVPLAPLDDKARVEADVASIRAGGGTDIYPALKRAIQALADSDAALKHIVLVSDGMTASGAYEPLIGEAFRDDRITLTAIGIGADADRRTLEEFAAWGGGNSYLVTDPTAIPAIFTRETLLATREFLKEEDVRAERTGDTELVAGLDVDALPPLHGYVVTSPKARATVPLVVGAGEHDDPLLAHWRYGLGRSVAWTSDARARWATDWLGTPGYTRLWSQVGRWSVGDIGDEGLQVQTSLREGRLEITVDAYGVDGGFANFLEGEARVVAPDLSVRPLELRQVGPGRYAASLPVDQDGSWLVGVSLARDGQVVGQAVEEAVQPYSPEYRRHGDGTALLGELARVGGGSVLADPARVFARPAVPRRIPHPLWPWLTGLAGFLLVLDVAFRRLGALGGPSAALTRPAEARPVPSGPAPEPDPPPPADPPSSEPEAAPVDPTSYAGRLLAARKAARTREEDR